MLKPKVSLFTRSARVEKRLRNIVEGLGFSDLASLSQKNIEYTRLRAEKEVGSEIEDEIYDMLAYLVEKAK